MRLRQLNSQNYVSSSNINAEFENIIRYLNVAELGDKTVGELFAQIFDDNGDFDGPIQFRFDPILGLQYRIGLWINDGDGWNNVATASDLRGAAGKDLGLIEGPFFYNRQDFTAAASQTVFSYNIDSTTDDILVYVNGLLQPSSGIYTISDINNTVTFLSGLALNDKVTIYSVRVNQVADYRRSDLVSAAAQAVFPFAHTADESLLVYRNGLLQRPGGAADYTNSPDSDTITFMTSLSSGDKVTIMTVDNTAIKNVGGLMLEDVYAPNGFIDYAKLQIADNQIPQSKVNALAATLIGKAQITAAASTPSSPSVTDLWLDTSQTPNQLKFYTGTQWLATNPASSLPAFLTSNASQYLRVNGTGTALEYGNIDFSTLVPKTYLGAANGAASLDSTAKVPLTQMPTIWAVNSKDYFNSGSVTNATVYVARIYGCKMRFTGWGYKLSAGTCTIQLAVDGATVGSTQAVSTSLGQANFGSVVEVDATSTSRLIQIVITGSSSATGLEVGLATAVSIT
jgi:hypothetical protein